MLRRRGSFGQPSTLFSPVGARPDEADTIAPALYMRTEACHPPLRPTNRYRPLTLVVPFPLDLAFRHMPSAYPRPYAKAHDFPLFHVLSVAPSRRPPLLRLRPTLCQPTSLPSPSYRFVSPRIGSTFAPSRVCRPLFPHLRHRDRRRVPQSAKQWTGQERAVVCEGEIGVPC